MLAVLLSGGGRTLANLIERSRAGALPARVGVVVSSVQRCRWSGDCAACRNSRRDDVRKDVRVGSAYSDAVFGEIEPYDPDLIILAGFLRKIVVPPQWEGPHSQYSSGLVAGDGVRLGPRILWRASASSRAGKRRRPSPVRPCIWSITAMTPARSTCARLFRWSQEIPWSRSPPGCSPPRCELYPRAIAAYLREIGDRR